MNLSKYDLHITTESRLELLERRGKTFVKLKPILIKNSDIDIYPDMDIDIEIETNIIIDQNIDKPMNASIFTITKYLLLISSCIVQILNNEF